MKCPKCGQEMDLEEKDTSSGRDMRTYYCGPCKVLHDAREEMEEKRRRAGIP
jgi:DNA-directed RNA polymerase subunit RPC12/RpoP